MGKCVLGICGCCDVISRRRACFRVQERPCWGWVWSFDRCVGIEMRLCRERSGGGWETREDMFRDHRYPSPTYLLHSHDLIASKVACEVLSRSTRRHVSTILRRSESAEVRNGEWPESDPLNPDLRNHVVPIELLQAVPRTK